VNANITTQDYKKKIERDRLYLKKSGRFSIFIKEKVIL